MRRPKTCGDDQVAPIEDSPSFAVVGGLTKREYFAAMALQGLLSQCTADGSSFALHQAQVAQYAVQHADALIDVLNAE